MDSRLTSFAFEEHAQKQDWGAVMKEQEARAG